VELHLAAGALDEARALVDSILAAAGYPGTTAPGIDRVLRVASRVHRLSGASQRAVELATAALDYSRRIARDERRSADVGSGALLRAQALAQHGEVERAKPDAMLAEEALTRSLGPLHAETVAATELLKRMVK
jgi:hypothetical protein